MFKLRYKLGFHSIFSAKYALLFLLVIPINTVAENGYEFSLRYSKISNAKFLADYKNLCKEIVVPEKSDILNSAQNEITYGISKMLGGDLKISLQPSVPGSIIIGSLEKSYLIKELLSAKLPELNIWVLKLIMHFRISALL
ncbi:MAG: alpha-glucuronidase family glycosyl hydrolase [Ignavibacteriales bacterium]|nr:alpha-glucuronidase family glycosyl hydrolase [Ignavibacteriales bacterium]